MKKIDFDEVLRKAVMDGLSSLGDSVRQSICYYLATDYGIKIQEIPVKTKEFDTAIGELLGKGAGYLEDMILNQLNSIIAYDVAMSSHGQQLSFEKRVEQAAKFYRSNEETARVSVS